MEWNTLEKVCVSKVMAFDGVVFPIPEVNSFPSF